MADTIKRGKFPGSVGAGMKSIFSPGSRTYYVLEHKLSTSIHRAGEKQEVIVDYIELGRDPKCQVKFDDTQTTVSRLHAAIVRNGGNWKLLHLSKTNETLLNGRPVKNEWYLQSGDEIQLSVGGPKLGFIIPSNNTVGSIGLSRRLSLFRQQALRPYKTAIVIIASIFTIAIGVGSYVMFEQNKEIVAQQQAINEANERWSDQKRKQDAVIAELKNDNTNLLANADAKNAEIEELNKRMKSIESRPTPTISSNVNNSAINACLPYVYFITTTHFEVTMPNGKPNMYKCGDRGVPGWTGTGFMLNNGKFVTARHVVEGWYFWMNGNTPNRDMQELNAIANNGGKVVAHFIAISSSGTKLQFSSDQFTCDRSRDNIGNMDDGTKISLANLNDTDFAYTHLGGNGGLEHDSQKCKNLERGSKLTVLGFPLGLGVNSINDISPIYGSGIVAAEGLQRGIILTTDTNYETGNSGGPVFYTDLNGKLIVVGIVSAGAGRTTGFVVPISVIR